MKKLIEVAVLGLMLLAITAPITKPIWAQFKPQGTIVQGVTPALGVVPVQVNSSGVVQTNIASSSAQPVTWGTTSSVSVTNAGTVQLLPANANRKGLIIQNTSTLYNVYIDNYSPVTATSGLTLYPGNNLTLTTAVPSGAWYALGSSATAAVVQAKEAQ